MSTNEDTLSNDTYSGKLFKRGKINKAWKTRYFMVHRAEQRIKYYAKEKAATQKKEASGTIDLSNITKIEVATKHDLELIQQLPQYIVHNNKLKSKKDFTFHLCSEKRTYSFAALNENDFFEWLNYLKSCIYGGVIKQGFLNKLGAVNKNWKTRYFVLNKYKQIKYYQDIEKTIFLGYIDCKKILSIKNGKVYSNEIRYTFELKTNSRDWILVTDTREERLEWMRLITALQTEDWKQQLDKTDNQHEYDSKQNYKTDNNEQIKQKQDVEEVEVDDDTSDETDNSTPGPTEISDKDNVSAPIVYQVDEIINNLLVHDTYSKRHETGGSIGNRLLVIYKYLLALNTTDGLTELYDSFYEMKYKLMNVYSNKGLLYDTLEHIRAIVGHECVVNECKYIKYKYRNRCVLSNIDKQYTDINYFGDRLCKDILSTIHCFMFHIYDLQLLKPIEIQQIKQQMFFISYNDNKIDKKDIKDKQMYIMSNKMFEKQSKIDVLCYANNKYFSKGCIKNMYTQSNLDMDEEKVMQNTNFSQFGVKFTYWNRTDKYYIACKYKNLKNEITQNLLFNLSIDEWGQLNYNCDFFLNSNTAKMYLSKYNGNSLIKQTKNAKISLQYLHALKLYTDYKDLCQQLCETFHYKNKNEIMMQLKNRHVEFVNWSKLLAECVQCFGKNTMNQKLIKPMYRGISNNFMFHHFSAQFNAPTSTSNNLFVIQSIIGSKGKVLELSKHTTLKCFYFDCDLISSYPEGECLIFGSESILKITTIKTVCNGKYINYVHYFHAMDFLLHISNGIDYNNKLLSLTAKKHFLLMVLSNYKSERIPIYIRKILHYQLSNLVSVTINCLDIMEKYKFVKAVFLKKNGTLNIARICTCFRFSTNINIIMPPMYLFNKRIIDSLYYDLNRLCSAHMEQLFVKLSFEFQGAICENQKILNEYCNDFLKIHWEMTHSETSISFLWLKYTQPDVMNKLILKTSKDKKKCIGSFYSEWYLLLSYEIRSIKLNKLLANDIYELIGLYYGKYKQESYKFNIRIWICSWNMGLKSKNSIGINESDIEASIPNDYDLYIFGLQETVSTAFLHMISDYLQKYNIIPMQAAFGIHSSKSTLIQIFYKQSLSHRIFIESKAVVSSRSITGAACIVLNINGTNISFLSINISNSNNLKSLLKQCNKKLFSVSKMNLFNNCDHIICFGSFNSKMSISTNEAMNKMLSRNELRYLWQYDTLYKQLKELKKINNNKYFLQEAIPKYDFYPTFPKRTDRKNKTNSLIASYNIKKQNKKTSLSFSDRILYFSSNEIEETILYPENNNNNNINNYCNNYGTISNHFKGSQHELVYGGFYLKTNTINEKDLEYGSNTIYSKILLNNIKNIFGSWYNAPQPSHDYLKIIMVGDYGIGKRKLLETFSHNVFIPNFITTIRIDIPIFGGKKIKFQIWDSIEENNFQTITTSYYNNVYGILLIYDITNEQSFFNLMYWMKSIQQYEYKTNNKIKKILIGNNCHKMNDRVISKDTAQQFANQHNIKFIESSFVGVYLYAGFTVIAKDIFKMLVAKQYMYILRKYLTKDKILKQYTNLICLYLNKHSINDMDINTFVKHITSFLGGKIKKSSLIKLYKNMHSAVYL